jgi:toxin ParE1/3/4
MNAKPVVPRERAHRDTEEAIDFYTANAGGVVALAFITALEHAYRDIGEYPAAGSPRYAHELELPDLRSRSLKRFPYLIFYVDRGDHIDIWRILHAHRDIPNWMRESDEKSVEN